MLGRARPIFGPTGDVVTTVIQEQDRIVLNHRQDVTAILDDNHQARTVTPKRGAAFRRIGQIPNGVIYQWAMEAGLTPIQVMRMPQKEFMAWCKRKLRDSDNKAMRTVEGNI